MKIELKGELHSELTALGLKAGDIIKAQKDTISKVGAMHFERYHHGTTYNCSVWPENYNIIDEKSTSK